MGLQLSKEDAPEVRGPEVTAMEAGVKARPPVWVMVVNPLIGVLGVILGSRVAGKRAQ